MGRIYGLDNFGLSRAGLKRLGARLITVSIQQSGPAKRPLFRLEPHQRVKRMSEVLRANLARLRRSWPNVQITARGSGRLPWMLDAKVPASLVSRVAGERGVSDVWIRKVPGNRTKTLRREPGFFCVWGSVAIQIEGRTRGLVDVEDRLVLVKAKSEKDAEQRLVKRWRQYAAPYLNFRGEMVRWQLIEILDVYDLGEDTIDPRGTEVFSRITHKQMKPAYVWRQKAQRA